MLSSLPYLALVLVQLPFVSGVLKCHQCSGWNGRGYSPSNIEASTCDNLNNQCQTQQYCVKKIDPIKTTKSYVTFTSDCWQTHQIQVDPTNLSTIVSGQCYPYEDVAVPPKRWIYCFCNNADYCNGSYSYTKRQLFSFYAFYMIFLYFWYLSK